MHPYVQYQEARILRLLKDSGYFHEDLNDEILSAFKDTIWIIKTNPVFEPIKFTKTYASILWLFGYQLLQIGPDNNQFEAARYFEESKITYDRINIHDEEYYQCLSHMGTNYLRIYEANRNVSYLRRARSTSDTLFREKHRYSNRTTKDYATKLRNDVKKYVPNL